MFKPHFLQVAMLMLILIFATVHSGLASLRDIGEKLIGERAFRVLFAGISLPLAMSTIVSTISYFANFLLIKWNKNLFESHMVYAMPCSSFRFTL